MFKTNALNNVANEFVDRNDSISQPGTRLVADDQNIKQRELVALVESSGQTLKTSGDFTTQCDIAAAHYGGGGGDFYEDAGSVNVYELSRPTSGSFATPVQYFDGLLASFKPANTNTTAATATIEIGALGAKNVTKLDGQPLNAGDMASGQTLTTRYNLAEDRFEVVSDLPSAGNLYDAYLKFSHSETSGTNGGGFTSGSWQTRTINNKDHDTEGIGSLASNQITLPAGQYAVTARAAAYRVDSHQLRLYDTFNSALLGEYGIVERSDATSGDVSHATIATIITVAVDTVVEIQHRCDTTRASDGFGLAASFGNDEVYLTAIFERIA